MKVYTIALSVGLVILVGVGSLAVGAWLLGDIRAARPATEGPYLGLTYVDYSPQIARQCCRPGALVTEVTRGGPADAVGIRTGDVIAVFNGHPLGDGQSLLPWLLACQPGEQVVMEVWRAGRARQVEIVLGRRDRP
jgi:S1-C subfamily serine protease